MLQHVLQFHFLIRPTNIPLCIYIYIYTHQSFVNGHLGQFSSVALLSHFSRVQLCATPWTAAHQVPYPWDSSGKNKEWVAISFSDA